ncbi:MAG: pilus assembly protein FimV, partial [Paracoccaceae bacterium]
TTDELLAGLADAAPEETPDTDTTSAALDSLADLDVPEAVEDTPDDLLAELAESAPEAAPEPDDTTTALDSLADLEIPAVAEDTTDDLLADLADAAPVDAPESNAAALALDSLADLDVPEVAEDTTDDLLAELADAAPAATPELDEAAAALDSLADLDVPQVVEDTTDALLADLADTAPEVVTEPDIATAALDSLADLDLPEAAEDKTDDLLADLADAASQPAPEVVDVATAALDSLVDPETPDDADPLDDLLTDDAAVDDLDDLLGDLGSDDDATPEVAEAAPEASDLDDLLADDADIDDLDDLLGDLGSDDDATPEVAEAAPEASDLDDLLADDADIDDLDDLLGDLGSDDVAQDDPAKTAAEDDGLDDLDDLLGDLSDDTGDDLDNLLGDLGDSAAADDSGASLSEEPEFAYGQLSADRPSAERLNRKRFRLAILGDFSGRAARGQLEIGDALAARKPILLDPDTVEDVIEGFATDLVLPIGKNGSGVAIKLGGLDDLHPDELYENVEIFAELVGLRGQLNSGATAENAARQLRAWGEEYDTPVAPTRSRSSGNSVPADLKLSDFQKLIGDTQATLTQASPLDELMAQIVGPHIRAIPDADTVAMKGAVDQALSAAMRLVLHHPEFQSIEAQWRSLDLIARSIEDDDTLDVMLYDVSAEEIGADLATADDLGQSGLVRLLTDGPLDEDNGRGGYSALIGLYTFEETPPHAELLGRIARVAAHVDAPFIAAITPTFLDTDKADRHPLVANAWDTLRGMPEAGHLALASPRFLLRQPYGAKSEPIYEFEFEEFTMSAGLRGMLWANPVVLVAILLAKSFRENGASMGLGSIMSLGGMPFYFVNDRYGDQVALPCTERNLTLDKVEQANGRGIMSVVSIKGRDEIRLASFNSLAGAEILGPWTGVTPPPPSPPKPKPAPAAPETVDSDAGSGDDSDLDDLLADFGDDLDFGGDDDDTDADLAALLADL